MSEHTPEINKTCIVCGKNSSSVLCDKCNRSEHTPLPENHCLDCCCARAWKSLGVTKYTGKAIYEHIDKLIAENKRLREALTYYKALYGNTGYSVTKESAQIAYNMARQALNESE